MTTDPSSRMLELLSLLQTGRDWAGADLASRLGCSPRTLRRDLERLRELGYPVESTRGPRGSYRLVAGRAMPPLLLTDDEAVATVVGLRFAALAQVDGASEAAASALRKLEQVLPARLRSRMQAVSASTEAVSRSVRSVDLALFQSLATAIQGCQDVGFAYQNRSGATSDRRVEPYRLVLLGRRWYLLAWDRDRADWRTFRLDRISLLTVPGTTFHPRPLPDDSAVSFVRAATGLPTEQQAVVRFEAPYDVVADRLLAQAGALEPLDETSCRFISAIDTWDWLAITIALVGVPYVIEGPPEFIDFSRGLATRITDATR
ncbi:helix-turn-helix transcriptional regulator [Flindersiella endophytica]